MTSLSAPKYSSSSVERLLVCRVLSPPCSLSLGRHPLPIPAFSLGDECRHRNAISPAARYIPNRFWQHGIELATASADVAGLIKRTGGIESIIRGAAYSRTQAMDISFMAQVSAYSPQFNLPVVAVQRGRDHGEHPGMALRQRCRRSEKGETREGQASTSRNDVRRGLHRLHIVFAYVPSPHRG